MSLADELHRKLDEVLSLTTQNLDQEYDWFQPNISDPIDAWFRDNFPKLFGSRTPRGGKDLKNEADRLLWSLQNRVRMSSDRAAGLEALENEIARFRPMVEDFVAKFSNLSGPKVVPEVVVNGNTYKNLRGFSEKTLMKYVRVLDGILSSLKGWKKRALKGGVVIALAGPDQFRSTAGGVYKSAEDVMYVRATPKIIKRTGGTYGSFEYIFVHEMGHRYEYKVRVRVDFDRMPWRTTRYSWKEGESFAELFALSHFGISEVRDNEFSKILERFEDVMTGKKRMARRVAQRWMCQERGE